MVNYFALHEYFSVSHWQLIGTFSLDNNKPYFPHCCIYGGFASLVSKCDMGLYGLGPPQKHGTRSSQSQHLLSRLFRAGGPCPASRTLGLPGDTATGIGSKECRRLLAVLLFTQARPDVFGLCTRRWQGRAVHAAFTSTSYWPPAFLGWDFKAQDIEPLTGIYEKYTACAQWYN